MNGIYIKIHLPLSELTYSRPAKVKVKVKQSLCRPGQVLRGSRRLRPSDFMSIGT
jgi:hypothetical protein